MRSQKAFTLVEVAIGVALAFFVGATIFEIIQFGSTSANSAKSDADFQNFSRQIAQGLRKSEKCTALLGGQHASSSNSFPLNFGGGLVASSSQSNANSTSLFIQELDVSNISADAKNANFYSGNLVFTAIIGKKIRSQKFAFYFKLSPAGTIASCSGVSQSDSSVQSVGCVSMGGIWNGSNCDLCAATGGSIDANGRCTFTGN